MASSAFRNHLILAIAASGFIASSRAAAEEPVTLDAFTVHGRAETLALPYGQLLDLSICGGYRSFTLSEYILCLHKDAKPDQPLRHLLRPANGNTPREPTSASGIHRLDPQFRDYTASSNLPVQFNNLYLLFRASCLQTPDGLSLKALKQLLDDYQDFMTAQVARATKHYEAKKKDDFDEVHQLLFPDEIVVFLREETQAQALAVQLGIPRSGRALRIDRKKLNALVAERRPDPFAGLSISLVECITPWRQAEPLPEPVDGATPLLVGWIRYRPSIFSFYRSDLIAPGLLARR